MRTTFRAVVVLSLLCGGVVSAQQASEKPKKPRPLVTISKETTYLVEPLRTDGYVDYVAAINQMGSKGVTKENNAAALLWQAFGPKQINEKVRERFFEKLGIPPPPEEGDYFVPIGTYAKLKSGAKPAQQKVENQEEEPDYWKEQDRAMARPWSEKDCPLVAGWLKANEKPLRVIVEATRRPRYYQPLVAFDANTILIAVLMPTISPCREAGLALKARAMLRLQAGKTDDAWADLLACHRLARLLGQGPTLVELLVGVSIDGMACSGDRAVSHYGRLRLEQAEKFRDDLRQLPPASKMAEKLTTERYTYLDAACWIARSGLDALSQIEGVSKGGQRTLASRLVNWGASTGVNWDEVLRVGNSWYDRLDEAMKQPTNRDRCHAMGILDKELQQIGKKARDPWAILGEMVDGNSPRTVASRRIGEMFVALMLPAVSTVANAEDRHATVMQLSDIALALAAYRAEHGGYPAELAKLTPKYFPAVPKDLYSGAEFRYKREGAGYVLYSLGRNGKDDGGRGRLMDPPPAEGEEVPPDADDIGFRLPAAP